MIKLLKLYLLILLCLLPLKNALAEQISIIRDDEIETALKDLVRPLYISAGFSNRDIKLYIMNNKAINAFTDEEYNIFINTGLLTEFSNDPQAVLGTVAHELGHIKAGHVALLKVHANKLGNTMWAGLIGSLAAAALTGSPEVAAAGIFGTSHVTEREFLSYTRENEEAADQAAINFLTKTGNSPDGLERLLNYLYKIEQTYNIISPYLLTHPLSRDRLEFIKDTMAHTKPRDNIPAAVKSQYIRAAIKLKAFLSPAHRTLSHCKPLPQDTNGIYACAIAYYKSPNLEQALSLMDELIKREPNNGYFHELKGQFLFETGHIQEAIKYFEQAHKLLPQAPMIKLELATCYIAFTDNSRENNAQLLNQSKPLLEEVLKVEPYNVIALRQSAIAAGKTGDLGMANLFLAEEALVYGNRNDALRFARLAEQKLAPNHPGLLKVKDIIESEN